MDLSSLSSSTSSATAQAQAQAQALAQALAGRGGRQQGDDTPPEPNGSTPAGTATPDGAPSGVHGSTLTQAQQSTLTALSNLLGTDSDGLLDSLQSGSSSLAELISAKGVDRSSLASILQDGLLFDATV